MAGFFFLTGNRIKVKGGADCIRPDCQNGQPGREGAAVRNWMRRMRHMRSAGLIALLGAVMVMASTSASAAGPVALSASEIQGCCVCRGTDGGNATTLRS